MKDSTIFGLYPTQAWAAVGALDFAQESNCPPPFQIVRIRIRKDLLERLGRQFEKDPSKDPSEIAYLKGLEDWTPLARKALFVAGRSFIESNHHKKGCAKGGSHEKYDKLLDSMTLNKIRAASPHHLTAKDLWNSFPTNATPYEWEGEEHQVYRDGDRLYHEYPNDRRLENGEIVAVPHSISFRTFAEKYVPRAQDDDEKIHRN